MKRAFSAVALLCSIILLISSCSRGVSQEKYDKVNNDLTAAQAQIQTLQSQVSSLQSDHTNLTTKTSSSSELALKQVEIAKLQQDLAGANAKVLALEKDLANLNTNNSNFCIGGFQIISHDDSVAGATVTVNVTNALQVAAIYSVILRIDGQETKKTEIVVQKESSEEVSFNVDRDVSVFTLKTYGTTATIDATSDARLPNGYLLEKKMYTQLPVGTVYEITYISDGLRVKGYLSLPNTPGRHPAIIWCRGGNKNFGLAEYYQISNYTSWRGWVAIGSQYRGNMGGRGQDQFGGGDVNDVVNLIPLLKSLPEVNPDRIGIVGESRGGMMAYMTLRKQTLAGTNDIKVAVIVSGSADLFFAARKQPDMLNGVFIPLIGGTPEQLLKEYEARSAVYWANDINVPILIQHGDQDVHVYIDEANKMAEELKKYGKTYKYVIYPGRGHDLIDTGQSYMDELAWLSNYLK